MLSLRSRVIKSHTFGSLSIIAVAKFSLVFEISAQTLRLSRRMSQLALPKNEAVRAQWDKFSALYEQHFRLWSSPAHAAMVATLELSRAQSVVEVGCGAGHGLAAIRAELPPVSYLFLN